MTRTQSIVKTIQWTVAGLLVAAYLAGSVVAGLDGTWGASNPRPATVTLLDQP